MLIFNINYAFCGKKIDKIYIKIAINPLRMNKYANF